MRTEMKNAIGMTELSNAVCGINNELSNDQLESVAGGTGLTPSQQAMASTGGTTRTPGENASFWFTFNNLIQSITPEGKDKPV